MATRSSDYVSRGILSIFWRRREKKLPELPLTDVTKGKLLQFNLRPTAQIYCDGAESSLKTLDVFFEERGKIPPARNADHSFKRKMSASYRTAQLKQVKELAVDEVGNLQSIDEEVALMKTEREIYCPPPCALKQ